eukprot:CAMPEP_0177370736 /NCGR_PEP_ID=MMETSP0368-20130122/42135_1 /TAXON_ID=447022 ORGANISM="Scrippsiella hangoei-like, Strain SHHI-4" /NCGR_SAMPLE_ID=MMETSP0368 /ASSEMBLY_ACC=CAM_ASM_000363 /LENGTH=107 /DNA_ID=CAMNT_0018833989 /DNA_START=482 /DNA_END=802 /DNA_ORIENTATION=+
MVRSQLCARTLQTATMFARPLQSADHLLDHDTPAWRRPICLPTLRTLSGRRESPETTLCTNAVALGAHEDLAEHHLQTDRALAQSLVDLGPPAWSLRTAASSAAMMP